MSHRHWVFGTRVLQVNSMALDKVLELLQTSGSSSVKNTGLLGGVTRAEDLARGRGDASKGHVLSRHNSSGRKYPHPGRCQGIPRERRERRDPLRPEGRAGSEPHRGRHALEGNQPCWPRTASFLISFQLPNSTFSPPSSCVELRRVFDPTPGVK